MLANKVLQYMIIGLSTIFVVFQVLGYNTYSALLRPFLLPLVTLFYLTNVKNKSLNFILFMGLFSIAELLSFLKFTSMTDFEYFYTKSFYIISFVFLSLEIISNFKIEAFLRNNIGYIIVLFVLSVFSVRYLLSINNYEFTELKFYIELFYYSTLTVMISSALLNYFSRTTQKSMFLLLGVVSLTVSELLQVAFFYVNAEAIFSYLYCLFLILAFYMLYLQSLRSHEEFRFIDS